MATKRKTASQAFEKELREQGYQLIGGMDEAGRGPLAGPVCAAVVIFEPGVRIPGVYDSKEVEPELREELYHKILAKALAVGVGLTCAEEIDHYNILRATKIAARRALRQMPIMPDYLLLDALILDKVTVPQKAITKGDSKSFSIAAASIVAKVTRDRLMTNCAEEFPGYLFESHKGYGTPTHRRKIRELGPCSLHRQTFLEAWFDTEPVRHSRLYDLLCNKLGLCDQVEHIHEILDQLKQHRDWFPITEWNKLNTLAKARAAAFPSP
jgi:ribonuclease HII